MGQFELKVHRLVKVQESEVKGGVDHFFMEFLLLEETVEEHFPHLGALVGLEPGVIVIVEDVNFG